MATPSQRKGLRIGARTVYENQTFDEVQKAQIMEFVQQESKGVFACPSNFEGDWSDGLGIIFFSFLFFFSFLLLLLFLFLFLLLFPDIFWSAHSFLSLSHFPSSSSHQAPGNAHKQKIREILSKTQAGDPKN